MRNDAELCLIAGVIVFYGVWQVQNKLMNSMSTSLRSYTTTCFPR